jgi:hypothetical protein
MSTLSVATIKSQNTLPPAVQNSSGTEIGTFCRAWVNFNGTGTVAIRASFNVSSITDNGTGNYTVNFTTAMPDANYSVLFQGAGNNDTISLPVREGTTPTASSVRVSCFNSMLTVGVDPLYANVAVFR